MTKTRPYVEMLKEELLALAQRLGLTNLSRLRKDEIIDLIKRATARQAKLASSSRPAAPARRSPSRESAPVTSSSAKSALARRSPSRERAPVTSSSAKSAPARKPSSRESAPVTSSPAKSAPARKPSSRESAPVTSSPAKSAPARKPSSRESAPVKPSPARKPSSRESTPVTSVSVQESVAVKAPAGQAPPRAHPPIRQERGPGAGVSTSPVRTTSPGAPEVGEDRSRLSAPMGPVSPQSGAVVSKFSTVRAFRPEELLGIDDRLPDLPESYGDNRIVLLPRDLAWLFAYWDLTQEYREAAQAAGGSVFALRLYDVTGLDFDGLNAHAMYEHECAEWAKSWYIPTPTPDRDYLVEIGYRGADQWFPLARSNRVAVPSDQPSTWIKDDFITIQFDESLKEVQDRLPARQKPVAETPPPGTFIPDHTVFDDGQLRIVVGGTLLPPSGVPSWSFFSGGPALLGALPPSSQAWSQSVGAGSSSFLPGSVELLAGSQSVPGSAAHLPGSTEFLPGSAQTWPSSGSFAQLLRNLAGTGPLPPGGGAAAATPGEGEDGLAGEADTDPPLLLASVEMVIAGRSLPGTEIRVAGRSIPLGPDGAFSLRITVPEGLREVPIEARSPGAAAGRRLTLRLGRESE